VTVSFENSFDSAGVIYGIHMFAPHPDRVAERFGITQVRVDVFHVTAIILFMSNTGESSQGDMDVHIPRDLPGLLRAEGLKGRQDHSIEVVKSCNLVA
jgi:hypothetical protein